MTWTNGRRLATISAINDHAALGFTYDSDGLRLTKTVGTEVHKYTWQGSKLIAEQYGDTALEFFYDESGAPYAFSYKADANAAEQIFYYVTDLQGDVMQILDASGNTAASYTYNAWGKILNLNNNTSANIGDLNPIRYRGYYYDAETGLYYLKSRYYDPEICRFINADSFASTGQGFLGTNMFAYCLNNPVNYSDLSGTLPEWVANVGGLLLGAVAGLAVAAVAVALAPEAICAATLSLTIYGLSSTAAETIATIGVSLLAANATVYAMDTGYTAVTADSPIKKSMGGDSTAYETWRLLTEASMLGMLYLADSGAQLRVCFAKGTVVLSQKGQTPIEEIQVGDLVWAWDEETGQRALKPVLETYVNETDELVHVFVNGEEIQTTPGHPFYSPVKGWTDAVHLRAGDILVLVNGEYVVVEKVQHELLEAPIHVYNFHVEGFHTYFVANCGVLVHNECTPSNSKYYTPEEIADRYGISVNDYHRIVKPKILEMARPIYKVGRNPNIMLNRAGEIGYQGANGKGFQDTGLIMIDILKTVGLIQ